ncbi:hypothetical protein QWZ10_12075 [Paracoccus cavernae]|uniref:Argininosuccinate lyase n=1 Tax=Paracoccus cavernae TaxID=1571207 RepID=A0ABT8D6C1_9RHOB|nr:hypothetical protein [Paracoccus cavernae]
MKVNLHPLRTAGLIVLLALTTLTGCVPDGEHGPKTAGDARS